MTITETKRPITVHEHLLRARAGVPELVEVPPTRFLMIDGYGAPGDEAFRGAIGALYAIAYTAKFALKKAGGPNVAIPPLELLSDPPEEPAGEPPLRLRWTLMLRLPDELEDDLVERARAEAGRKKGTAAIDEVRVEELDEGLCAQVLNVGPYAEERSTIELLHRFIVERGRTARGRHHEIYLSDPARSKPDRLKTIIRQPVAGSDPRPGMKGVEGR